jgi:alkaline phosphatase
MTRYTLLSIMLVMVAGCAGQPAVETRVTAQPSVILIIGDGMDDQQITIGRNYLVGSTGRLVLDNMPYRGAVQVRAVAESDPARPVYVGDSASGATAMATGVVTSVGRINTAAHTGTEIPNIMELARAAGLRTGIVTTASITDASPAAFVAHISDRDCEGPDEMLTRDEIIPQESTDCTEDYLANGGPGSIAEQIAVSDIDIVLGGGSKFFRQATELDDATSVFEQAQANGFTVIRSRPELVLLPDTGKVLGVFAAKTLPVKYRGVGGGVARFVERGADGIKWPEPFGCEENPDFAKAPSLVEMTRVALGWLDGPAGFMLMIESASIDKEAHYWRPCGHIGEIGQLNDALQVALDYAEMHPDTLVIVASDHGQAPRLIPEISWLAPQNFAPTGRFARVRTPEGGVMGIGYATNDSPHWEEHSGVQVPLFASGPGARNLPTFMQQTDIYRIVAAHLGFNQANPDLVSTARISCLNTGNDFPCNGN